jgi:sugar phosphate isomerase/epimerase
MKISKEIKIGSTSSIFGGHPDRFVAEGYKDNKSIEYKFEMFTKVPNLKGVDLSAGGDINTKNVSEIKELLHKFDLIPAAITADIVNGRAFSMGSVCSPDKSIRELSWLKVKESIDLAIEINCEMVNLWFGQDGYDYCFQVDYIDAYKKMLNFLKRAADYNPNINIAVEYKPIEPRKKLFMSTAAFTLAFINEINKSNLGITLDNGHAWNAGENISETVCFLKSFGDRLKYIHFNDNYKLWDDDMAIGSIHLVETIEFLYWLEKTGYKGFYMLDVDPSRENALEFAKANVNMLNKLRGILEKIDEELLNKIFQDNDAIAALALVRENFIK